MSKDYALEYQAKLEKLKRVLERIETSNLNFEKSRAAIDKICEKVNKEVDSVYDSYELTEEAITIFKEERLAIIYDAALKSLDGILHELEEQYSTYYYKLAPPISLLRILLDKENYAKLDLAYITSITLNVLDDISNSFVGETKEGTTLITDFYKLAYRVIKKEFSHLGNSKVFDYIKNKEVHILHLEKQLLEEVKTLDEDDERKKDIMIKMHAIESKEGISACCFTEDIVRLLAIEDYSEIMEEYLEQLENLEHTLDKRFLNEKRMYQNQVYEMNIKIPKLTKEYKNKFIKSIIRASRFPVAAIITSIWFSCTNYFNLKEEWTTTTYLNTVTEYDDNLEVLDHYSLYKENNEDTTEVIKYEPWVRYEENIDHERRVLTYDVSDVVYSELINLIKLDLDKMEIAPSEAVEYKEDLLMEDLYRDIKTVIRKTKVDLEKYQETIDYEKQKENMDLFEGLMLLVSIFDIIMLLLLKSSIKETLEKKKNNLEHIERLELSKADAKRNLSKLIDEVQDLTTDFMILYNRLPDSKKDTEKVKQLLLKINDFCDVDIR